MGEMEDCPRCGGNVKISPQYGGRGTGELTVYYVMCENCDFTLTFLGNTGKKITAIREYNKYAKAQKTLEDKP